MNFNEILVNIHTFSLKKIHLQMLPGKWQPSCLGLNVLMIMKMTMTMTMMADDEFDNDYDYDEDGNYTIQWEYIVTSL